MRRKVGIILSLTCLIIMGIIVYGKITEDTRFVKKCYIDNADYFDYVTGIFKNYEGYYHIRYDHDLNEYIIYMLDKTCKTERCEDETLNNGLGLLEKKYRKYSDYDVFKSINTYYDQHGNMVMVINVQSTKIKDANGWDEPDIRDLYLIYIDEEYIGSYDAFPIDYIRNNDVPIAGRWYYCSDNSYSG